MTQAVSERERIGGNLPPPESVAEQVTERLTDEYKAVAETVEKLAARANEAPKAIATDEEHATVAQLVRDVTQSMKNIEAQREAEKAPHLAAGRAVDGFFGQFKTRIEKIGAAMNARITDFLRAKEAAERRVREEEARRAREAEAEALRKAQEAQEAEAKARAEQMPIEAEQSRSDGIVAFDQAAEAERRRREAEAEARAKPAELARTRTSTGVLSTLRTEWKGEITEYDVIDLEALRPFLKRDDVQKAVNQFVRINKGTKPLRGVRIYEDSKSVTQ